MDQDIDDPDARPSVKSVLDYHRSRYGFVSPIWRHPDVAEFVAVRLRDLRQIEVYADCLERYGEELTPSRSAISRFATRLEACEERLRELRPPQISPSKGFQRGQDGPQSFSAPKRRHGR